VKGPNQQYQSTEGTNSTQTNQTYNKETKRLTYKRKFTYYKSAFQRSVNYINVSKSKKYSQLLSKKENGGERYSNSFESHRRTEIDGK